MSATDEVGAQASVSLREGDRDAAVGEVAHEAHNVLRRLRILEDKAANAQAVRVALLGEAAPFAHERTASIGADRETGG